MKIADLPQTSVSKFSYLGKIVYCICAGLFTAYILHNYSLHIAVLPQGSFLREVVLAFGQLIFQGIFLLKYDKGVIINYFMNLITISLVGSLILLPMLFILHLINVPEIIILGWFGLTAALMFAEHYRRVHVLRLPKYLCFTWVAYRALALIVLLNL